MMRQKLKRTNRKRLASLSALGAGALGVAAIPANANDIVFSGVVNVQVPWTASTYTIPGPNGAGGSFASSAAVLTSTSGSATASALTANGIPGTLTITAASAGVSVTFHLTIT